MADSSGTPARPNGRQGSHARRGSGSKTRMTAAGRRVVFALAAALVAGVLTGALLPDKTSGVSVAAVNTTTVAETQTTTGDEIDAAAVAEGDGVATAESSSAESAPESSQSADASETPSAAPTSSNGVLAPIPATRESKAQNVPNYPLDGGHGRRIVYDKALMTVYIVDASDQVVLKAPVIGRWDRPVKGTYHIYSKSDQSSNPYSKVTFDWMTRFAWGYIKTTSIGFHAIPKYMSDGSRMSPLTDLGLPIATGGCVRMSDEDAKFLYDWAKIGDTVVVLPSP